MLFRRIVPQVVDRTNIARIKSRNERITPYFFCRVKKSKVRQNE